MKVLKRLFSKNSASSAAAVTHPATADAAGLPQEEAVAQMSLVELQRLIDFEHGSLPQTVTIGFITAIYRRAMEIAYHSHGTASEDRTLAAIIAKVTRKLIENGGQTEGMDVLRTAIERTEYRARTTGYGTLYWLLKEHEVPPEKTINFIMRVEYAHLLGSMLDVLKPDVRARLRPGLVAELLRTRRVGDGDSVVIIAHWLAVSNGPATVALFNPAELTALRNAHRDYAGARTVLSDLGLLPPESSARGFEPEPPGSCPLGWCRSCG